jgi:hypothetical protein
MSTESQGYFCYELGKIYEDSYKCHIKFIGTMLIHLSKMLHYEPLAVRNVITTIERELVLERI